MTSASAIPLKVLFVSGTPLGTAASRYRCEHLAEVLRISGAKVDVVYIGQPRVRVAHDVVVLYRVCATAEGKRFAGAARACGAALVYSTDDLVFDAEKAPPQMGKRFRALAPLRLEMMRHADAALASTEYLAEQMRAVAQQTPVYTVRNFLSTETLSLSEAARRVHPAQSDRVTLGYLSGSPTHDEDFAVAAEPLRKVLEENEQAELLVVGPVNLPEALADRQAAGQIRRMDAVDWRKLPALMAQGVSINLAPLDLSRSFCHAKSEVKYLEAAALGIPTVASASEGFLEAATNLDEKGGSLLAANADDWVRFMNLLIQHKSERESRGDSACEHVHRFTALEENRGKVNSVFAELSQRRTSDRPQTPSESTVNWPFSVRYAVKGALERTAGVQRAFMLHRQKGS